MFLFCMWATEICGGKCFCIGELPQAGFIEPDAMEFFSGGVPEFFVHDVNVISFEVIAVVNQTFAKKPDGFFIVEFLQELFCCDQAVIKNFFPTFGRFLIGCDKKSASLGIENDSKFINI